MLFLKHCSVRLSIWPATRHNQWGEFGAELCVYLANWRQRVCSGNLSESHNKVPFNETRWLCQLALFFFFFFRKARLILSFCAFSYFLTYFLPFIVLWVNHLGSPIIVHYTYNIVNMKSKLTSLTFVLTFYVFLVFLWIIHVHVHVFLIFHQNVITFLLLMSSRQRKLLSNSCFSLLVLIM